MSDYNEWAGAPRFERFGENHKKFDDGATSRPRSGKKGRKKFKRKDKWSYDDSDGGRDNDCRRNDKYRG